LAQSLSAMTFILALANNEYAVQISDRRLTSNGKLVDDESNKCGVIFCLNARMAFGYTGIANWGNFSTQKWLLSALNKAGEPDFTIGEILERLKTSATIIFDEDALLKNIPKIHKRLAIMFTGFINLNGIWKPGCAILSNYHDFETNNSYDEAQDNFRIHYTSAKAGEEKPTLVQRIGNWRAMTDMDIDTIRQFLHEGRPSNAIVGKSLELIRDIADRPGSANTIGKQLTSIEIPRDTTKEVRSTYSSDCVKPESYMPAIVHLTPEKHLSINDISIRPVDKNTKAISVPKVSRNRPCPCGSEKKYKYCHGR